MTWQRACELLQRAVNTLAKHPGEVRARLHEARDDIFLLDELTPAGSDDASYTADINDRIATVRDKLAAGGVLDLSEDEGADLASEIVELASMVCQGAKDER
jgi:hypothetical protein